jgi:hypothetical protein
MLLDSTPGTRLMGGKDAASPRYVFTKLEVSSPVCTLLPLTDRASRTYSKHLTLCLRILFRQSLGASSTPMMTLSSITLTTMVRLD